MVKVRGAQGMVRIHSFVVLVIGLKLSREGILRGEQIELAIDLAAGRVRVEEIPGGNQLLRHRGGKHEGAGEQQARGYLIEQKEQFRRPPRRGPIWRSPRGPARR